MHTSWAPALARKRSPDRASRAAGLLLVGGAAAVTTLALERDTSSWRPLQLLVGCAAALLGIYLAASGRRVGLPVSHALGAATTVLLTLAAGFDGETWLAVAFFYPWVALYFASFFPTRDMVVQLALVAACFVIGAELHPGPSSSLPVALAGAGAIVVAAAVVHLASRERLARRLADRRRLLEAENRFETLVGNVPGAAYRCGCDYPWKPEYMSDGIEQITGFSAGDFVEACTRSWADIIHPDDLERVRSEAEAAVRAGDVYELEYRIVAADGCVRWINDRCRVVRDPETGSRWLDGAVIDITQRKTAERELAEAEAGYRTMIESLPLVTYMDALDAEASTIYISPQIETWLGYPVDRWVDHAEMWQEALHPEDRERVLAENRLHNLTGRVFRSEYRLRASDGRVVWVLDEAVVERDAEGHPFRSRGYMLDITERRRLEEQLSHRAFHDDLTGLANRALFRDRVEHALARGRSEAESICILYVDLDRFKEVNDTLGHAAGDEVLVEIARVLVRSVREMDTVARIGGDEFGLLLERVDDETVAAISRRIVDTVSVPLFVSGREVFVSASVGVAIIGAEQLSAEEAIQRADVAMYEAKSGKKNHAVHYAEEMSSRRGRGLVVRTELQQALGRDELVLRYQPIVDLGSGSVVGAEALVRWSHPTKGLLAPAEFLEVAESSGQIVEIGRWVLGDVCRLAAELGLSEQGRFLALNISVIELHAEGLVEHLRDVIGRWGIDPHSLVVEITETVFAGNTEATIGRLEALRQTGVRIALDDFGTGYSSLSFLGRLPLDIVKVPRPFVVALGSNAREEALASAVVALGRQLQLTTVAEGVETEPQRELLVEMGCDLAQGFLFAPALEEAELADVLSRGVADRTRRRLRIA